MDTLVAKHSRPDFEQDVYEEYDQAQDLSFGTPGLSLKFAMPPIADVCDRSSF